MASTRKTGKHLTIDGVCTRIVVLPNVVRREMVLCLLGPRAIWKITFERADELLERVVIAKAMQRHQVEEPRLGLSRPIVEIRL